jgi:TRAP-type transport system periplasmic protein
MRRLFTLLVALLVISVPLSVQAETWNMATPYPDFAFHTVNIRQFADDVKKASNGKLEIKVHSGQSLIKHPEIKNAIRSSQVQMGEFLLGRLANENAIFEADMIPFLASNYDEAKKLWTAQRPHVEKLLARSKIKVLYSVPWSPQGLFAKKSINTVNDMKTLRFRAYSKSTERLATLLGMVPTQTEATELATAFLTGRVDSMMTSPATGANNKAWDWVSHYYHVQGWLPKNIVVVSEKAFGRLDKATQEALLESARKADERGWKMSVVDTEKGVQKLKEHGMKGIVPSAELKAGLKDIGKTMTQEWLKKSGKDGKELIETYRKSL